MIRYWLDPDDRIVRVNDEWKAFARANQGAHLAADELLGQPLWEHVTGVLVRQAYERLFARVRDAGVILEVPYRCDAPDVRRFMTLRMKPLSGRGLLLESRVDRLEERRPVDVSYAAEAEAGDLVVMCAWCKRVAVDGWHEVDEVLDELDVMNPERNRRVTHGMCHDCERSIELVV